ncbi:MAG: hypothetical protein IJ623_05815 [Bacteroidales bacterium]|nr:hypothetical protein [Bacteroidales bacterium]
MAEFESVIAVDAALGIDPDVAVRVLGQLVGFPVAEAVGDILGDKALGLRREDGDEKGQDKKIFFTMGFPCQLVLWSFVTKIRKRLL